MNHIAVDYSPFPAWNDFHTGGFAGNLPIMESRNFEFLRKHHGELADLGAFAETYAYSDPASALLKLRLFAEFLVKAVFAHHKLELSYQSNLNDLLHDVSFQTITPSVVQDKLHLLRINGNKAAHGTLTPEAKEQVPDLVKEAFDLGRWHVLATKGAPAIERARWTSLPQPDSDAGPAELKKQNRAAMKKIAEQEAMMASCSPIWRKHAYASKPPDNPRWRRKTRLNRLNKPPALSTSAKKKPASS